MKKDILKENFSTSVVISEDFKKALLNELKEKELINLNKRSKMNPTLLNKLMFGAAALLGLVGVSIGGYYYIRNNNPELLKKDLGVVITNVDGNVKINGKTAKVDMKLNYGDVVTTDAQGYVEIKSESTNIYANANSKVEINKLNDEIYPEVRYGNVYVSSSDGDTKVLANAVNIEISNGAGLFNVVESKTTLSKFVLASYAADLDVKSTVANISGEVIMGEKEIKPGFEIEISKDKSVTEYEIEREKLKSVFCEKVYESETDDKNNTGTFNDLTAPVVTVLSPKSPYKTDNSSVAITFKSNEDGWYYNSNWIALKANQEVTINKSLKAGNNDITITVKDSYYNKTTTKVSVNYEVGAQISWKQNATNSGKAVFLKWQSEGVVTSDTFVIFRNGVKYKKIDVTSANKDVASYSDTSIVDNKTYSYEIKVLRGDQYIADTTKISIVAQIVAETPINDGTCRVSMSTLLKASTQVLPAVVTGGDHMAKFAWTVSGDCEEHQGYKLVWNKTGSPAYSSNYIGYDYISDNNTKQGVASGLEADTYYFRVCLYRPSTSVICSDYSNQIRIDF